MKVLLSSNWGPNLAGSTVNVYDETARYLVRMGLGSITDHNENISLSDGTQKTQVIKPDGTPVDFAAQFTALIAKFTDATQLVQSINVNGRPQSKPDFFDTTTSATIVYEGYKVGASVLLCKIDLTAGTRTWGTDTWANRATATYA